jgi:low temperature requirement protein LtrA
MAERAELAEPVEPAQPAEKRVTWAELFFDLVFVFAVTQVSALLHHDHSWAGVGRALVVFVPVWWAWVGTTIHANTHDVDRPLDRLGIFAVGLGSLFMALGLTDPYGAYGVLFGASYWALRLVLAALVFRGPRLSVNAFSVALFVTGPLLLIGGLLDGGARVAVWAVAALIDLAVPRLTRRKLALVHFEPAHLPERFGLFVIVALGESIVAVGVTARGEEFTAARLAAVAAAFVLACGLWWVYFHFAADAAYGHLGFIAGIVAVAVGLAEVVHYPGTHLHLDVAGLLLGGTALYLAVFGYTRWRMFGSTSPTRLTAAAVCLLLLVVAPLLPALALLALLATVVVALNVVEALRVRRAQAPDPATYLAGSAPAEG